MPPFFSTVQSAQSTRTTRPRKLTVGILAAAWGVAPESLRNWERAGLIPDAKRTPGGHRRYGQAHVAALTDLLGPPRPGVLPEPGGDANPVESSVRPLAAVA